MTSMQMIRALGERLPTVDAEGNALGWWESNGLRFPVAVADVRSRFGTLDVQIIPVGGSGARWVELSSVHGSA